MDFLPQEPIHIADAADSESGGKQSQQPSSVALPAALPILGLTDVVIFPAMVTPLAVESGSSLRLIDDVIAGDRLVGLALQKNPETKEPAPEELHTVACLGRILRMLKYPDGTARILVEGLRRIRIYEWASREPYPRARCEIIPEEVEDSLELAALARSVKEKFQQIAELSPALNDQVRAAVMHAEQPGQLADMIAANVHLNLSDRQKLLEIANVKERLKTLLRLLMREAELLELGSKIQKEASSSMSKTQREFFLREQLKAIQKELGEGEWENELETLAEELRKADLPEEARKAAMTELGRLRQTPPASAEYVVLRNYLDWIVNLPWNASTEDRLDLRKAEEILEAHHYGLKKVKERLLEFLAVMQLKRDLKGPILCLVGPPGVGKTSLGRSVAEALGRKFLRISLGGVHDEAEIRGFRRTYVGSMPGRIIQGLRRVKSNNPVFLLDELDKVGSGPRGDPASALLEALDPEQNHAFIDHYLDVPFDLSRVLFLATANWLEPVHPALRDRLEVIELPSYTVEEKLQIAKRHIIPRQLQDHGLKPRQLRIRLPALRRLIREYTREAGVRQLVRGVAALSRKAARQIVVSGSKSVSVKAEDLPRLLGAPPYRNETADRITECGIAIGLAWTPVGGDILFIEATKMPGKGRLILTGSLGEVMKESAQTALSLLRSQARTLDMEPPPMDQVDLHIHVPAGATPKDGPSAGVTIFTALASLFAGRRVRSDLAMTGEISLRGRVLPVGGIKEKVLAAARSGLKEVILPEANRAEWNEVPEETRRALRPRFVKRAEEAARLALRPLPPVKRPGGGSVQPPGSDAAAKRPGKERRGGRARTGGN